MGLDRKIKVSKGREKCEKRPTTRSRVVDTSEGVSSGGGGGTPGPPADDYSMYVCTYVCICGSWSVNFF